MKGPSVLYLSSGGIEEPLIVSQVVAYLKRLACDLRECHLMTFERTPIPVDRSGAIKQELAEQKIQWHPIPTRTSLRMLRTMIDIQTGYRQATKIIKQHAIDIVHARSFVPGQIGLKLKYRLGTKFLYDMRGLWAMEKAAKGTIRSRWVLNYAQRRENRLFYQADGVISLTERCSNFLRGQGITTDIWTIPTCVDLDRFPMKSARISVPKTMITVGSMGPGYLPRSVFRFFLICRNQWPDLKLEIITRSNHDLIQRIASEEGCDPQLFEFHSASPEEIPARLQAADIGLCLIDPSEAKIASCPTKLGEYLACGLPVVANSGIGDVREIIQSRKAGIVIDELNAQSLNAAAIQLADLFRDPELSQRCRKTAEERLGLPQAVDEYRQIYQQLWEQLALPVKPVDRAPHNLCLDT